VSRVAFPFVGGAITLQVGSRVVTVPEKDAVSLVARLRLLGDEHATEVADQLDAAMLASRHITVEISPLGSDAALKAIDHLVQRGSAQMPRDLERLRRALVAEYGEPDHSPTS